MKKIIISIFLLASISAFAQTETLTKENLDKGLQPLKSSIQTLQKENSNLKAEISNLNIKLSDANQSIDSLRIQTQANSNAIAQTANELGVKITTTETNANQKISEVDKSLSKNSLYGIVGVLFALLLSGLLYWLLSKRQVKDKGEIFNKLITTKENLEKESIRLDKQLIEVIEKQLKIADTLNANKPEIDHTFHKNSANELMRIRNYANTLDPPSQDAIALKASIANFMNYFNSNGYEIIDFTGQVLDERLPININKSSHDKTLPKDKEVIVKTWEPLIKYKGEKIQDAKVDTKYNN